MQRRHSAPRTGWEGIVQAQGLSFYLTDGRPYWDESAYYEFSSVEIDAIEVATYALDKMCLEAVEHVIRHNLFEQFMIPPDFVNFVKQSWENDEHTIYGRFDLAFDGGTPKLLEYNADTPTGLIEAAVIQWFWLQDVKAEGDSFDQFNTIHERLIEAWKNVKPTVNDTFYFTSLPDYHEDYMTVSYLRDTAIQAGLETDYIEVQDIGWNRRARQFTDKREKPIRAMFKLYPWEWLVREQFAPHLLQTKVQWLEAPWKMLLSNKAILPVLHQLFPGNPYLLPAHFEPHGSTYIRKPVLSREGANTTIVINGEVLTETEGPYSMGRYIYQQYFPLPQFDGKFPIIGSWMVNGYACGIGIREDSSRITSNQSSFVPHLFSH